MGFLEAAHNLFGREEDDEEEEEDEEEQLDDEEVDAPESHQHEEDEEQEEDHEEEEEEEDHHAASLLLVKAWDGFLRPDGDRTLVGNAFMGMLTGASRLAPPVGNCGEQCGKDCADKRRAQALPRWSRQQHEAEVIEPMLERLFSLQDLDGNGLLSKDALVRLNVKIAQLHHGEDTPTEPVKQKFSALFQASLDGQSRPVPYDTFRSYMLGVIHKLEPDDAIAQEFILDHFIAEAELGRAALSQSSGDRAANGATARDWQPQGAAASRARAGQVPAVRPRDLSRQMPADQQRGDQAQHRWPQRCGR